MKRKRFLALLISLLMLTSLMPTAMAATVVNEDVEFILSTDENGDPLVNGDGDCTVRNIAFNGKVTLNASPDKPTVREGDDRARACIWFENCAFNGGIELVGMRDLDCHAFFDESCTVGEIALVGGDPCRWGLSGPVSFNTCGLTVDMRETGILEGSRPEDFGFGVSIENRGEGAVRTLCVGTDRRYNEWGFDRSVKPVVLSGVPEGLAAVELHGGYTDISGVTVPEDSSFMFTQYSDWDESCINVGGNTLGVFDSFGDQFYMLDGGLVTVYNGNRRINAILTDAGGNECARINGGYTWRWGDSYSMEIHGRGLDAAELSFYLDGQLIDPENYDFDENLDDHIRTRPNFDLGDDLALPRNDDERAANDLSARVDFESGSVLCSPLTFGPWQPRDGWGIADQVLWDLNSFGIHTYDEYVRDNDPTEDMELLASIWPEHFNGEWSWGDPWSRSRLSFLVKMAGIQPGDLENPPEEVSYSLARAFLSGVWLAVRGSDMPAGLLENIDDWQDDWRLNHDMWDNLYERFRSEFFRVEINEPVTYTLTTDGNGRVFVNGEDRDWVENTTFNGPVTIVCDFPAAPEGNYNDWAGELRFRGCVFNGDLILSGDDGYSCGLRLEDCAVSDSTAVSITKGSRDFQVRGRVKLTACGITVDMTDAAIAEDGLWRGDTGIVLSRSGELTALTVESDTHYNEYGFDLDMTPVIISGEPEGTVKLRLGRGSFDISGVSPDAQVVHDSGWDQSYIITGGRNVTADAAFGEQYYSLDGGRLTVSERCSDISPVLVQDGHAILRLRGAEVWRWGDGQGYEGYSVNIGVEGGALPKSSFVKLLVKGEVIDPKNYRYDGGWEDGFTLVPNVSLGEDLFWPENDFEAGEMSLDIILNYGSVFRERLTFGPWQPKSPQSFADNVLRWLSDNGIDDYDEYIQDENPREDTERLAELWPDYMRDGFFDWGGPWDRSRLSFFVRMAGIVPGEAENIPDHVEYWLARRFLNNLWRELKGGTPMPEGLLEVADWQEDYLINDEMFEQLFYSRFAPAFNSTSTLAELAEALDKAWDNGGEVRVGSDITVDAAGLSELAERFPRTVYENRLRVPVGSTLVVGEGASLTVNEDARLVLFNGDVERDGAGMPVFEYFDWGPSFRVYSAGLRVERDALLTVDGELEIGKYAWLDNDGALTVNGTLTIPNGEHVTHGYVDEDGNGGLVFTESDWIDERGGDGWVDIVSGGNLNNSGRLSVKGSLYVGITAEVRNNCWFEGSDAICGTIDISGTLSLNGRLENQGDYRPDFRPARAKITVSGLLTTDLGKKDVSRWGEGVVISNDGSMEILDGGRVILGEFDVIENNAWGEYDGTGTAMDLRESRFYVLKGGELVLHGSDFYNGGNGLNRAMLSIDGSVTLDDPIPYENDPNSYWVATIKNDGVVNAAEGSYIDCSGAKLANFGVWRQDGAVSIKTNASYELSYASALQDYPVDGAELTFGRTASLTCDGESRVYVYCEEAETDGVYTGKMEKPDLGAEPEAVWYTAWAHTPGAVISASEQGFAALVIYDDMCFRDVSLSFRTVNTYRHALTLGVGAELTAEDVVAVTGPMTVAGGKLTVCGTVVTPDDVDELVAARKIIMDDGAGNVLGSLSFSAITAERSGENSFSVAVAGETGPGDIVIAALYSPGGALLEVKLIPVSEAMTANFKEAVGDGSVSFFLLGDELSPKTIPAKF